MVAKSPAQKVQPSSSFYDHLQNEIHPIFSDKNFPSCDDYNSLKPTLRLASNFLTAPCLLPFWHTMFFGRRRRLHLDQVLHSSLEDLPKVLRRRNRVLNTKKELQTKRSLRNLALSLEFHIDTERLAQAQCLGLCTRLKASEFNPPRDTGSGSRIFFDKRLYSAAIKNPESSDHHCLSCRLEAYRVLSSRAALAVLLVHEVTHAISNVTLHEGVPHENFFEDYPLAELGTSFEMFTFGGHWSDWYHTPPYDDGSIGFDDFGKMHDVSNWDLPNPLEQCRRPNKPCQDHKARKDNDDCIKGTPRNNIETIMRPRHDPQGVPIAYRADHKTPDFSLVIPVPAHYIFDLFTNHFWTSTVVEKGLDALYVANHAEIAFIWDEDRKAWADIAHELHDNPNFPLFMGLDGWMEFPGQGIEGLARRRNIFDELPNEHGVKEFIQGGEDAKAIMERLESERHYRNFW